MKAAVFRPNVAQAAIEPMTLLDLRDDEVLVKLVATGICHTDVTCRDGIRPLPRPIVLGHEGAGHVERVGRNVISVAPGDAVVLSFQFCGRCESCRSARPSYCEEFVAANFSGRRLDGSVAFTSAQGEVLTHFFGQSSFATHSVAHVRNVVKVRNDAPLHLLGPLGCGIQTGVGAVMNVMRPASGSSLAIVGGGGVGLSALMAAVIAGCSPVIVVEPNPARRELALELGAAHVLDPGVDDNLVDHLRDLSQGGVNFAFDTCGIPTVIDQAIQSLRNGGKMVLATTNSMDARLSTSLIEIIARGISICGVHMGDSVPQSFIPVLVDLIVEGRLPVEKLMRFYALEDVNRALEDQEHGRVIKPVLRMS